MPRTAPIPNIPAIPGMCPGFVIKGGGGAGGGSGAGGGKGRGGKKGAKGKGGKNNAEGGGKKAKGGEGCGDPVCPITGKMFLEVMDFAFWATKSLKFIRHYNTRRSDVSESFGFGWTHPLGWRVVERRTEVWVFDERGDRQTFDKDELARKGIAKHPFGWTLARLDDGYLLTQLEGELLAFERHRSGRLVLTRVSDIYGNSTEVHYSEQGHFIGMTDSEGRLYRADLDRAGRVVLFRVALNATQGSWLTVGQYRYDEHGDLVEFIDAEGFAWRYRYENHLMVEHRTAAGLSYLYRYDGHTKNAYCIESWGEYVGRDDPALLIPISARKPSCGPFKSFLPKGINYVRFTYDKASFFSEVEDGLGGVTRFEGDEAGRVVKKFTPDGGVESRNFDEDSGAIEAQAGADGFPNATLLDDEGYPSGFVRPNGTSVHHAVDGRLVESSDSNGGSVLSHLDDYGQPTWVKLPDGTTETSEYNSRGLLTKYTDRSGGTTRYVWDDMGNLVAVCTPSGHEERRQFDYLGRCIEHVSESGEVTVFRYDARSEVIYKRTHDGTEAFVTYDANRKVTMLEIGDRVRRFEYGGLDWLISEIEPDGASTEYRYDVEGNIIWVRNARSQEYRAERDHTGGIIRVVDFEGQVEERRYDYSGRVTALTTAFGISNREYDNQGRLTKIETPDDSIDLAYGASGANTEVTTHKASLYLEHDALGRVILEQQGRHETEITWKDGSVHEVASEVGVPLRHDIGRGALNALQAGGTLVQFIFPRPRESVALLGRHLVRRDQYDEMGNRSRTVFARLPDRIHIEEAELAQAGAPEQLLCVEYVHNGHGEVSHVRRSDGYAVDYATDAAGRIIQKEVRHHQLAQREQLRYDAVGTPLVDGVFFDAQMRPSSFHGETFEYDVAGQLKARITDEGVWRYEWDFLGNLVAATGAKCRVEMDYDGRGRRLGKRVLSSDGDLQEEWSYVWSNQTLLHEVNHTTGWTRTYLRKPDAWSPFGHVDSREEEEHACFYVEDETGMPNLAFDKVGNVVWSAEHTVFGHVTVTPGSNVDVRVRFAGQQYDEHLGLVYNRMRWYDPRVGQYVSPDPLSLDAGVAPRNYVSNPTLYIDPMGQAAKKKKGSPNDPLWPNGGQPAPVGNHPTGQQPPTPTTRGDLGQHMGPGPFATTGTKDTPGFIDCPDKELHGTGKDFSKDTRAAIDKAGQTFGCHGCGSKNPMGPEFNQDPESKEYKKEMKKNGNPHFVPDHQPPRVLYRGMALKDIKAKDGKSKVKLFPHCKKCASMQGGQMAALKSKTTVAQRHAKAKEQFGNNASLQQV